MGCTVSLVSFYSHYILKLLLALETLFRLAVSSSLVLFCQYLALISLLSLEIFCLIKTKYIILYLVLFVNTFYTFQKTFLIFNKQKCNKLQKFFLKFIAFLILYYLAVILYFVVLEPSPVSPIYTLVKSISTTGRTAQL